MRQKGIEEAREKLLEKAKSANGKTVGEIDATNYLSTPKNKGRVGQVIQIYLGKDPDNDPSADFPEADLELKVTGLVAGSEKSKFPFRAKERLVLHQINYVQDHGVSFEDSGLLSKCDTMLISCYQYIPGKDGEDPRYDQFPIIDSFIYHLGDRDLEVIKDDYNKILDKINAGLAETISESDTQYLAACTKGANSSVMVNQYRSKKKAKPRAFSLKASFLSAIIRQYVSQETFESVGIKSTDIEETIMARLRPWFGKSEAELRAAFPEVSNSKSKFASYVSRMVGAKDLEKTEEFQKANIHLKTVRVEANGTIRENMSFGSFDFKEVAYTDFYESKWFSYFEGARFLFVVFRNTDKGYVFDKAVFYRLPDAVIDDFIRFTYLMTANTLIKGEIVSEVVTQTLKDGSTRTVYKNNFIGSSDNAVCHVRPHASNFWSSQKELPCPDKLTGFSKYEPMCFWLDRKYIKAILEDRADEYLEKAADSIAANLKRN